MRSSSRITNSNLSQAALTIKKGQMRQIQEVITRDFDEHQHGESSPANPICWLQAYIGPGQKDPFINESCTLCTTAYCAKIRAPLIPKFVINIGKEVHAPIIHRYIACKQCFQGCFENVGSVKPILQQRNYEHLSRMTNALNKEEIECAEFSSILGKFSICLRPQL